MAMSDGVYGEHQGDEQQFPNVVDHEVVDSELELQAEVETGESRSDSKVIGSDDEDGKSPRGNRKDVACRFFMKNSCKYDEECRFSHDSEVISKAQQARAERSREKNQQRIEKADRSSQPFRVSACLFWRQGRCRYGNACRFVHAGGPMYPAHMAAYAMHAAYPPGFYAAPHPGAAGMAYAHPQGVPVALMDQQFHHSGHVGAFSPRYSIDGSGVVPEPQQRHMSGVMLAPVRYYQ